MSTKKFWQGMFIGALVGGAISLFDRTTREAVKEASKQTMSKTVHYIKHPNEAVETVKTKTEQIRQSLEEISDDVSFIVGKVGELKEMTPQVTNLVTETKDTFTKKGEKE